MPGPDCFSAETTIRSWPWPRTGFSGPANPDLFRILTFRILTSDLFVLTSVLRSGLCRRSECVSGLILTFGVRAERLQFQDVETEVAVEAEVEWAGRGRRALRGVVAYAQLQ